MAEAGNKPPTAGRNHSPPASTRPSRAHPRHRRIASVRQQHRSEQPSVQAGVQAAHFGQTGPAGKRPYSPARIGLPAMSVRQTDRQPKNPLPIETSPVPQDSPASTDRRAAALQAAPPAETVDLPGAREAASPVTPRRAVVSLARVLPVAEVSPRIPPGAAVSLVLPGVEALPERVFRAAAVLAELAQKQRRPAAAARSGEGLAVRPGEPALAVYPPKPHKRRKRLSPARQEPGHLQLLVNLGSVRQILSPAQQEWVLAVPSAPPFPRPGTAGISRRLQPRPRPERRVPVRHSRNTARPPERTNLQ